MAIRDDLHTIQPELMNITRLFGIAEESWGETPRFSFTAEETDGQFRITFTDSISGEKYTGVCDVPADADVRLCALHRKRAARRLCKQSLYDLCRRVTGFHPTWGSSTGVRPTHLMYEALARGMTMEQAIVQMQREFDMTEEKARLLSEIITTQQKLPAPGDNFADVYIGIPFCPTRCTYCSFSSGELGDGRLVEPYLTALFREMEATARLLGDAGKTLRALYIGGGTPTALNEDQLRRLLRHMKQLYPNACEYTVEAGRPDSITRGKLEAIRDAGVGRISINPQSMVDRTLQVIGRGHTAKQVEEAYALARDVGMGHINMDIIAGLPGENTADFAYTLDCAKRLRPESLTVHTLAIKRSSKLALDKAPLPDADTAAAMVAMSTVTAREMGLEPYYLYRQKFMAGNQENVGYALPGHACLYNVDIMEENTHILAMGACGISKRVFPEEGHIERAPNVGNIQQYIDRVDEMIERKRALFLGGEGE
ncbi:MAG: coproporphyrinogen dehydrogenase HemZ [Clostridia bacterium]|nr:coproporphyrinogen dehydrogenase HemZ [Clostridia bacterium]